MSPHSSSDRAKPAELWRKLATTATGVEVVEPTKKKHKEHSLGDAKRKDKKTKKEMMNLKGYAEVDGDTEGVVEMKEKERVWLEESDLVPSPKSVPRPKIKKEFDVFDDIMSTMPSTMTKHYYDGDAPVAAPVRSPTHRASATFAKAPMRPPVRQLPDFDEY